MPGIMVSDAAHKRVMDRRDSKLMSAADVVEYALDCMDELEKEDKEV